MAEWLHDATRGLPAFLASIRDPLSPARYRAAREGVLPAGSTVSLGFTAHAIKLYVILGHWETMSAEEKNLHVALIRSYQREHAAEDGLWEAGAFIDLPLVDTLRLSTSLAPSASEHVMHIRCVIRDESKEAITALAEVGASPRFRYTDLPVTPDGILNFLDRLDWHRPWSAGGQASVLVTLLATGHGSAAVDAEGPLLDAVRQFLHELLDTSTGAYFSGPVPAYGNMINGAMRVLTALDWLQEPIHVPERLIDTCLSSLPRHEGCQLVDAAYVLHRCVQETRYRREEISEYCKGLLEMIRLHHNPDGGFSYWIGKSQTVYHGVPITVGMPVSDVHGTMLLTWALAMVIRLIGDTRFPVLSIIRP